MNHAMLIYFFVNCSTVSIYFQHLIVISEHLFYQRGKYMYGNWGGSPSSNCVYMGSIPTSDYLYNVILS